MNHKADRDDSPDVARIAAAARADPAIQAAADQLHAAARDRRPMDAEQEEAISTILAMTVRHAIDILAIPPDMVPHALAAAARAAETSW